MNAVEDIDASKKKGNKRGAKKGAKNVKDANKDMVIDDNGEASTVMPKRRGKRGSKNAVEEESVSVQNTESVPPKEEEKETKKSKKVTKDSKVAKNDAAQKEEAEEVKEEIDAPQPKKAGKRGKAKVAEKEVNKAVPPKKSKRGKVTEAPEVADESANDQDQVEDNIGNKIARNDAAQKEEAGEVKEETDAPQPKKPGKRGKAKVAEKDVNKAVPPKKSKRGKVTEAPEVADEPENDQNQVEDAENNIDTENNIASDLVQSAEIDSSITPNEAPEEEEVKITAKRGAKGGTKNVKSPNVDEVKKVPTKKTGKRMKATEETGTETAQQNDDEIPKVPASGESEEMDESIDEASKKGAKKGAKKGTKKGKASVADSVEEDKGKKAAPKKGAKAGAVEPKKKTRKR